MLTTSGHTLSTKSKTLTDVADGDTVACMKEHVAVRLSAEEIEQVDAVGARLSTPWLAATRSDSLRAVIQRGLAAFAGDTKKTERPKRARKEEGST